MLRFSPTQLPDITSDLTDYEQHTLNFCHEWAAGKQAFTLHTSGSTGTPKPIVLTRQQMQASARMTGKALQLQPGDSALVCLNTRYIAGTMMLVRGMELGLTMTVVEPSGNPFLHLATDTPFDFTALVPMQIQHMLTQTPAQLPILQRMKAILVGGAPVSYALEEQMQVIQAPLYSTYGMTETVSHVALRRLNGRQRSDSYTALEGVRLGLDLRGCLWITAPSTDQQLVQTNDLAELLGNNTFRWLGRTDNIINSGGIKIQLEKIEQALDKVLAQQALSCRFVAFGLPHLSWGDMLCVAFEHDAFSTELATHIKQQLAQSLSVYEIPKQFFFSP
ncbi:MAG: AMP-binding protein, partial [Bacteroidota bacterium]